MLQLNYVFFKLVLGYYATFACRKYTPSWESMNPVDKPAFDAFFLQVKFLTISMNFTVPLKSSKGSPKQMVHSFDLFLEGT